jgi:polyisoprenoid-binding protein YceI
VLFENYARGACGALTGSFRIRHDIFRLEPAMPKTVISLAFAASLLVSAAAQAQGPAGTDPHTIQSGTYAVEPNHTEINFSVLHFGFTYYSGVFSKASGDLTLDPRTLAAAKLNISVPIDSVLTTSAKLDNELRGDSWLDAQKYPTMTFQSTKIELTGPTTADVAGDLTFHGVTRPIVLKASLVGAGIDPLDKAYTVGFQVTGDLKRSDFGVKAYIPLIGDDVHLNIAAAFKKKAL